MYGKVSLCLWRDISIHTWTSPRSYPQRHLYYTSFCTQTTVGYWLPMIVVGEVVCFKGCISRCVVKSSGVWETTHSFTSGLPPGVMLNGVLYNTSSCMHRTVCSWLLRVMSGHRCIEIYMAWTVMFIVDVLSHNQIYGEDVILMGVKYPTYLIWQYHQNVIMEAPYIIAMIM